MATVQTLQQRFEMVQAECRQLQAQDREFIKSANTTGTPNWTPELRAQRAPVTQQLNEMIYLLNYRRELLECRTMDVRVRWQRHELDHEESVDEQQLVATKVAAHRIPDLEQMDADIDKFLFDHGYTEWQVVPESEALEQFKLGKLDPLDLYLLARYQVEN